MANLAITKLNKKLVLSFFLFLLIFLLSLFPLTKKKERFSYKTKAQIEPILNQESSFFLIRSVDIGKAGPTPGVDQFPFDGIVDVMWKDIELEPGIYDFSSIERRIEGTKYSYFGQENDLISRKYAIKIEGSFLDLSTGAPRTMIPNAYKRTVECPPQYRKTSEIEIGEYPDYENPQVRQAYYNLVAELAKKYNSDPRISAIIFGMGIVSEARAAKSTAKCDWLKWSYDTGLHYTYLNDFLGLNPTNRNEKGAIITYRDVFSNKVTFWPLAILSPSDRRRAFEFIKKVQTSPPRIGYAHHGFDWEIPGAYFNKPQPSPTPWLVNEKAAGFNDWFIEFPDWPALGEDKKGFEKPHLFYWTLLYALGYGTYFFDSYWSIYQLTRQFPLYLKDIAYYSSKKLPQNSRNLWIAFHESIFTNEYINNCHPIEDCLKKPADDQWRCWGLIGDVTYGIYRSKSDQSQIAAGSKNNLCGANFGFEELPFAQIASETIPGFMARKTGLDGKIKLNIVDNWLHQVSSKFTIKIIFLNNHTTPQPNNQKAKIEFFNLNRQKVVLDINKNLLMPENKEPWIEKEFKDLEISFSNPFENDTDIILSDAGDGPDYFHLIWIFAQEKIPSISPANNQITPNPSNPILTLSPHQPSPTYYFFYETPTPPRTPTPTRQNINLATPTPTNTPKPNQTTTPSPNVENNYLDNDHSKEAEVSELSSKKTIIEIKLKLQGVTAVSQLNKKSFTASLYIFNNTLSQQKERKISFNINNDSQWSSRLEETLYPNHDYYFRIKTTYHLGEFICQEKQFERRSAPTPCTEFINPKKENLFIDLTQIPLRAGDLDSDEEITSYDLSLIYNNLGKNNSQILDRADVNFDGVIDSQDYSLAIQNLSRITD